MHMYISPRKNGYPNVDFLLVTLQGDWLIIFGRCYYEDDSDDITFDIDIVQMGSFQ